MVIPPVLQHAIYKTQLILSIKPLRIFLEKGHAQKIEIREVFHLGTYELIPNKWGKTYFNFIEAALPTLKKVLNNGEIQQLKNVNYLVPPNGVFIFIPGFLRPLLAFNLHNLPDFSQPGWISHITGPSGLKRMSKSGLLTSPIESMFTSKDYFSTKFQQNMAEKRLTDGISFSFEEKTLYAPYLRDEDPRLANTRGGMLLFPIRSVLQEGLALDFYQTTDGWPEILLKDQSYYTVHPLFFLGILTTIRKNYLPWINNFKQNELLFELAKSKISLLHAMTNSLTEEEILRSQTLGEHTFLAKDFTFLNQIEKTEQYNLSLQAKGIDPAAFWKQYSNLWQQQESPTFKKLNKILSDIDQEIQLSSFNKQALFSGTDLLFIALNNHYLNKSFFTYLIESLEKNNFLLFSLSIDYNIHHIFPQEVLEPAFTIDKNYSYLTGTLFEYNNQFLDPEKTQNKSPVVFLILAALYQRSFFRKKLTPKEAIEEFSTLPPKKIYKLFISTKALLLNFLEHIIKTKLRTKHLCQVSLANGLLLLNTAHTDSDTLFRLINNGIPLITQFRCDIDGHFSPKELDYFFTHLIPLTSLPYGRDLATKESYFYLKGNTLFVHERQTNKTYVLY
ncbi:MAG: hypothetical protein WC595_02535 [Candidatus Nanoarchaeia archaeon]